MLGDCSSSWLEEDPVLRYELWGRKGCAHLAKGNSVHVHICICRVLTSNEYAPVNLKAFHRKAEWS